MNCSFVGFRTPLADVERSPRACVSVCVLGVLPQTLSRTAAAAAIPVT